MLHYERVLKTALFVLLIQTLGISQTATTTQTVIEDEILNKNDAHVVYFKDKNADQNPADADMLFHIPGLTLLQSFGPVGPAQIYYRGLAHGRFKVDLEGLPLNNPVYGFSDANSMFLFAAKNFSTNAQSLSINLPNITRPMAKGVFGFGSQNSFKLGGSAGTPLSEHSSLFSAIQLSSTNGEFSYSSTAKTPSNANFTRENNDQHRAQGLVKYQRNTSTNKSHALFAFTEHEGGIPGFAFAKTLSLRGKSLYSGFKLGTAQKIKKAEFGIDIANSIFDYTSTDSKLGPDHLTAASHEITLSFKNLGLPSWLDLELGQKFIIERAFQLNKTRLGAGLFLSRIARFKGRMKPTMFAHMSIIGFHQHGIIRNKNFGFSFDPTDFMNVTARIKYANRLPTFMEMYVNNRFFEGNEHLKDESIWDIELSTDMRISKYAHIHLSSFVGFINDMIVYLPHLSTKLRPDNSGSARRYGIDLALSYQPTDWLLLESKNSVLGSKIKETKAPLPGAPLFSGFSKVVLGSEDYLAFTTKSRYRTSTMADTFGSLTTNPYALFDVVFSSRLQDTVGLSFSISNIFNVKVAQDSYEMPISGTVLFAQIELGTL